MKKALLALLALPTLLLVTACEDEKVITAEQLPASARQYIEKTYPTTTIVYAKKDTEWFQTEYKVRLDNGMEMKFNSDGEPTDIDMDD